MDIAPPTSDRYGEQWTAKEVDELFAPAEESVTISRSWLAAEFAGLDIDVIAVPNDGSLTASMPVAAAVRAFSTRFYEYEDLRGRVRIGCDNYSFPV